MKLKVNININLPQIVYKNFSSIDLQFNSNANSRKSFIDWFHESFPSFTSFVKVQGSCYRDIPWSTRWEMKIQKLISWKENLSIYVCMNDFTTISFPCKYFWRIFLEKKCTFLNGYIFYVFFIECLLNSSIIENYQHFKMKTLPQSWK